MGSEMCIRDRSTGLIHIMGEISTSCYVDIPKIARQVIREIGYDRAKYGFDCDTCGIITNIDEQSADIALGVDQSLEAKAEGDSQLDNGAGDQGMMFGYATSETHEMLPLPYVLACEALDRLRDRGAGCLLPDAKCQVTFDYGKHRIDTFLISTQHTEEASSEDVYNIVAAVMRDTARRYGLSTDFKVLVNPTGRFVIGGSFADTGVTGRKIIADTYGGVCRHGGGAFSGKDPTKVDRSAAYMARKIAKDIVRAHLARRVEVQLAYAIGVAEPVSISVDCFGTNLVPKRFIVNWIRRHYDLTPAGIISFLGLRDVDYNMVSYGGHFRHGWMPWEK